VTAPALPPGQLLVDFSTLPTACSKKEKEAKRKKLCYYWYYWDSLSELHLRLKTIRIEGAYGSSSKVWRHVQDVNLERGTGFPPVNNQCPTGETPMPLSNLWGDSWTLRISREGLPPIEEPNMEGAS
jgi:hypothetical protein